MVKMLQQQPEQNLGRFQGRPRRPVQHVMVAGVIAVSAEAHDAQRRSHVRWPGVRIVPTSRT